MSLSNALHSKEITTAQVSAVSFGFFSPDEIRKISVKQITSPVIFDNLRQPIRGGLYDPALGPLDQKDKCGTCHLSYYECPGHLGHVELSVPLYNPLVFTTLYKLLRCCCLHCFRFRMAGGEVERYRRRLELLARGRLQEARALVIGSSAAAKKKGGELIDDVLGVEGFASDEDENGAPDKTETNRVFDYDVASSVKHSAERASQGLGPRSPATLTAQTLEAMIDTVGEFFRKQPNGKCQNCGAHNPTVRREGHSKLFILPLPPKKRAANATQGTTILAALSRLAANDVAELHAELTAGLQQREARREQRRTETRREAAAVKGAGDDDAGQGLAEDVDALEAEDDDDKKEMAVSDDDDDDKNRTAEGEDKGAAETGSNIAHSKPAAAAPTAAAPGTFGPQYLTPTEVHEVLKHVWAENEPILAFIYPTDVARRERRRGATAAVGAAAGRKAGTRAAGPSGYEEFFVQTVPVAPNRFRPVNHVGDAIYEHPQNTLLSKLINGNLDLIAASKGEGPNGAAASEAPQDPQVQLGRTLRLWLDLQNSVNALFDSSAADETHGVQGIRQQLEKKEGLFRKNMMGKRVNFAARSVISPDVYLNGGEIGVPPYFASRLSFPERVTPWNVERLREAVLAGPGRNPGAIAVEDERGRIVMLRRDKKSREAVAKTLYAAAAPVSGGTNGGTGPAGMSTPGMLAASAITTTPGSVRTTAGGKPSGGNASAMASAAAAQYGGGKVVYRTMQDGDFMLTNRQPTLHKPGMMGHRARIMRAERTIRFHYANCSTFNADFDGDEINLHLPQDHLGRAEGYDIVHADHQFFVPTDGKPLRGLIQDHIVAGTLLTMKDTFLTQNEYCQLIYECIAPDCSGAWDVWMEPPAVMAPRRLWTGKQVMTAILMHYTRDQLPFTMATDCKVPADVWGKNAGEGQLHVFRNHLVAGCVDKAAFGKHGLLHVFHELYGPERTSILTAALSRLFTAFIQHHGFTCGMADVFLIESAEMERKKLLAQADMRALEAAAAFVQVPGPSELHASSHTPQEDVFEAAEGMVRAVLGERFRSNAASTGAALDMKISGAMHPLSSEVVKACLPGGQARPFRHNMMALMTVTGAKGSVVNFSQISCLLGQQELEGRRVPRMASGKSLPCFAPYDSGARSGGFVGDRFLTGLRPQEYYFHCMAGREGLVDTTVKTSRSGYLQRCLVKNLEPLRVSYDLTVRDDCDGSVVQFLYGEDGIDTTQTGCLRTLPLLFYNLPQFAVQMEAADAISAAQAGQKRDPSLAAIEEASVAASRKRAKLRLSGDEEAARRRLPVNAQFLQTTLGVTSEGFQDALDDALFGGLLLPPDPEHVGHARKTASKRAKKAAKRGVPRSYKALDPVDFQELMHVKFYRSQAQPGEAVGVVAAQSVGEPSTQMTLNTFHMAGRGEANVTLGIPRLREILMTAAAKIKTPVMTLPLMSGKNEDDARHLAVRLKRIFLAEAVKRLWIEENVVAGRQAGVVGRSRSYTVSMQFHAPTAYPAELEVTFEEVKRCFYQLFVPRLKAAVKAELRRARSGALRRLTSAKAGAEDGAAVLSSEAEAPRRPRRSEKDDEDENQEDNEEYVEGKARFAGGKGEQATYDAGDEEDREIAKAARKEAIRRAGGTSSDEDEDDKQLDEFENNNKTGSMEFDDGNGIGEDGDTGSNANAASYTCSHTIALAFDDPKLLIRELAERVAAGTVMRGVPGIGKCYVLDASARGGEAVVQTDGINLPGAAWLHADLVDVHRVTTNSPAAMLQALGVEAARATIVKEVSSVFGAYGIAVDPRHLSLIADHMTHMGGYRACNRIGIEASTSPFLKISFETAASFLVAATLHGDVDPLSSPAARIVLGRPVGVGTGSMDVVQQLE